METVLLKSGYKCFMILHAATVNFEGVDDKHCIQNKLFQNSMERQTTKEKNWFQAQRNLLILIEFLSAINVLSCAYNYC